MAGGGLPQRMRRMIVMMIAVYGQVHTRFFYVCAQPYGHTPPTHAPTDKRRQTESDETARDPHRDKHVHTQIHTFTPVFLDEYVRTSAHACACESVRVCVCMYACTRFGVCACVWMYVCMFV